MPKKITITPRAKAGLWAIETYIEKEFGTLVLTDFNTKFDAMLEQILQLPHAGKPFDTPEGILHVRILNKLTSILYQIQEEEITIIYVLDNRMDKKNLFN